MPLQIIYAVVQRILLSMFNVECVRNPVNFTKSYLAVCLLRAFIGMKCLGRKLG